MPTWRGGWLLSAPAAEEGVEVASQGARVGGCAVDVGGGSGAEHGHAKHVESGGAGDDAAVVAEAAGPVTHGDVEPGGVGPEACRTQHGVALRAREVQFQGGAGVDAGGCDRVRWREVVVDARAGGPLVGPVQ